MARPVALRTAIDLAFSPVLATLAARQPLPPGMITVLRIAGGCATTLEQAVATTGEPPEKILQAARLFLETVLFTAAADSYRILGADRSATQAELRDHMRWLMKWLHPDREQSEWESSLALRVSSAWDHVKTAERRQRYDAAVPPPLPAAPVQGGGRRRRRTRIPWIRQSFPGEPAKRSAVGRIVAFAAMALLGAGVAASFWAWTGSLGSFNGHAYGSATGQVGSAPGR
jgi:hypothetical protein